MKITVKDIDVKVKDAAKARAEIERAKEEYFKEKQELSRKAEEAADAGNVDLYYKYTQDAGRLDAAAHVREVQLRKKDKPVTENEVNAAWSDFVAGYNKSLAAGLSRLEKAKSALLSEYSALIDLQEEALITRARLAGYVGQREEALNMSYVPVKMGDKIGPEEGVISRAYGVDSYAAFYLANKVKALQYNDLYKDGEFIRVNGTIYNRKVLK